MKAHEKGWIAGAVWGVAEVLRTYGEEVLARHMLRSIGGLEKVRKHAEPCDIEEIEKYPWVHEANESAPAVVQQRLVRRFPIDFRAIAAETGCTKGTIGHNSMFGWHVQNGNGPADFCTFTPPEIAEGETLRIEGREWAVYTANAQDHP